LKAGDSISWKEISDYGRVETHTLCFDGSGLDISYIDDLPKLVTLRIEFDLKGPELICALADKYALNTEISLWRGNKLQVTSNLDKTYKLHSEAWKRRNGRYISKGEKSHFKIPKNESELERLKQLNENAKQKKR
jgi:hypothetical protein